MPGCDQFESLATRRSGCGLPGACCDLARELTVSEALSVASAQVHGLRETIRPDCGV
jgi:hypothetical protein